LQQKNGSLPFLFSDCSEKTKTNGSCCFPLVPFSEYIYAVISNGSPRDFP
jgi:hypothetical protein